VPLTGGAVADTLLRGRLGPLRSSSGEGQASGEGRIEAPRFTGTTRENRSLVEVLIRTRFCSGLPGQPERDCWTAVPSRSGSRRTPDPGLPRSCLGRRARGAQAQTLAPRRGCCTNRSPNRCVNQSRDNTSVTAASRRWDDADETGRKQPPRPTVARATFRGAFTRHLA
jgi:hypothetical protein